MWMEPSSAALSVGLVITLDGSANFNFLGTLPN